MNVEKFKMDMAAFTFKQHQDILAYLAHLKANGWTVEDAQAWIEKKRKDQAAASPTYSPVFCPECRTPMRLLDINYSPATQTGNPDEKSMWYCAKCGESIYNKEDVKTVLSKRKTTE